MFENEALDIFSRFENPDFRMDESFNDARFANLDFGEDEKSNDAPSVDMIVEPEAERAEKKISTGGMQNFLVILEPPNTGSYLNHAYV